MKRHYISADRQREVYENIEEISTPRASYFVMVILSTTIAAFGLLANSTAVVIGAMLVAPLMGPIFGIGLAAATGDRALFKKSLAAELLGVLVALLVGFLIGILPLRLEIGSEIIARTQPTLYDIIIALASGLAGAYALVDEKISPALPGVAIATALVPPLATCSICLAAGRYEMSIGALLLFIANFIAIELAAAAVFTFFSMSESKPHEPYTVRRFMERFGVSLIALVIVAVFMTQTLVTLIRERKLSQKVSSALSMQLKSRPGVRVTHVTMNKQRGRITIIATILTPKEFYPAQVGELEEVLQKNVDPRVSLIVRSLISRDADRHGLVFIDSQERQQIAQASRQVQLEDQITRTLKEKLIKIAGAKLDDVQIDMESTLPSVIATVDTPSIIYPAQVKEMEENLRVTVDRPVRLVVKSLISRDADSERFLYTAKVKARPLSGEQLAFHQLLQKIIAQELFTQVKGSNLLELRYAEKDKRLVILAVVRTPKNFTIAEVRKIEQILRKKINPETDLIVRSVVGTDTSSSGFVFDFNDAWLGPGQNHNSEEENGN